MFTAFQLCRFEDLKVIIMGQDPYHGEGQAHGLAFSTLANYRPPSLEVIFGEINRDVYRMSENTKTWNNDLSAWAWQGVLLLNTILTVEAGKPLSHRYMGWERFCDVALWHICKTVKQPFVVMLWGAQAKQYKSYFQNAQVETLVLDAAHPAAETYRRGNAGFNGCGHFSTANLWLQEHHRDPIHWSQKKY